MTMLFVSKSSLRVVQPPSDDAVAATITYIEEGARKSRNLDRDIARLQALHNGFVLKRQTLLRLIESHKALVSPLHGLPSDILEEIFHCCLPTAHNATMSHDEPPLLFGRVSKRWREIVYSSPRMWATLHVVVLPRESPQYKERMEDMTKTVDSWLSRSGILPISISMYHGTLSPSHAGRRVMDSQSQLLFNAIARHSRRWRSVYLSLRNIDWPQLLSQLQCTDVPVLEALYIKDDFRSFPWNDSPAGGTAAGLAESMSILRAPRLRSLDLPGYFAHRLCGEMQWHALTSLYISYWDFPFQEFSRIISHLPNLIECLIRISYDPSEIWPYGDPATSLAQQQSLITFPKLRSLLILATPDDDFIVKNVFRWVSVPSLVHLSWKRTYHGVDWSSSPLSFMEKELVESLREFLSRLTYPLEELDLSLQPVSQSTLAHVLECVPNLKRLSTGGYVLPTPPTLIRSGVSTRRSPTKTIPYHHDDEILRRLIPGSVDRTDGSSQSDHFDNCSEHLSCLCPNLEIVKYESHAQFSHKLFLDLIRSRSSLHLQNGVAHLRCISIRFRFSNQPLGPLSEVEESRIVAMAKDWGIIISIECPSPGSMGKDTNEMAIANPHALVLADVPISLFHQWSNL